MAWHRGARRRAPSAGASRRSTSTRRTATDDAGEEHSYEKLLLATGGTPRRVEAWDDGVIYYRTLETYRQLHEIAGEGVRAVVVGGGFIGSEVAAALAMNGCAVTIVFPDAGVGAKLFPTELARFVNEYYESQGVDVRAGRKVESISRDGDTFVVTTDDGAIEADVVVAGSASSRERTSPSRPGSRSTTACSSTTGPRRRTRRRLRRRRRRPLPGRGARRDAPRRARGPREHPRPPRRRQHGRRRRPVRPSPVLLPDLFDLGYEAVGDVDSRLETVAEWAEPNRKGVVCYVEDGGREVSALGRLGSRRCRARPHPRRRARLHRPDPRADRLSLRGRRAGGRRGPQVQRP